MTTNSSAVTGRETPMPLPSDPCAVWHGDMQWWREARYGMFVHYGPFSQWYDRHFAKIRPAGPAPGLTSEENLRWTVDGLTPDRGFARHLASVARDAGMKYIVFTSKHHEGFSLWDSRLNDYNSVRMGPGFDMVAEYVKACREAGLRVGIYYSLWDHHHPDGRRCEYDSAARRRFLDYTQGLLRELLTGYGKIDVLWYDGPSPLGYGGTWEAREMNAMVRHLQPGILVNDRALTAEDFTCSEGHITATLHPDHDWEACMPFHKRLWTWFPTDYENYYTARDIVDMFQQCIAGTGNLLMNVGPDPATGRIGKLEQERLAEVSRWLKSHGAAIYGPVDRIETLAAITNDAGGKWTRSGNTAYLWLPAWPDRGAITLENVHTRVLACSIVSNGQELGFEQTGPEEASKMATRVTIRGLPKECPDPVFGYAILKVQFDAYPQ